MHRRDFLIRSATAAGAAWLSSKSIFTAFANTTLPAKFSAADTVTLGSTGIKTSRLAMGTGTVGSGHHSHQTALGIKGLSDLLLNGYDHGLRFFDSADSYGSHPHVAEALKHVPRDKVTVLTKSWARDAAGMRAAAKSPWVEIDLARINPIGAYMDADPATVVGVLREMKSARKALVGMKILGQGELRTRQDEAIKYALSLGLLDAFTIGAESKAEQEDLIRRIAAA
jgi:hypothetical protein